MNDTTMIAKTNAKTNKNKKMKIKQLNNIDI